MRAKIGVTREEALRTAEACTRLLQAEFGVGEVHVCGSAAGEAPWHARSDLDLVVEGLPADRYYEALAAVWQLLPEGLDLDLLRLETAPPSLVRRLKEGEKMPEDPRKALAQEIRDELERLARLEEQAATWLRQRQGEPGVFEIMGAGKIVHDFYSGTERIFERIAVRLDEDLPPGTHWHTDLALRLHRYLRFRHLFRHTYGFELVWNELRPLVEGLPGVLADLRARLARFL